MKKFLLFTSAFFFLQIVKAQTITITDPDYNQSGPIDCTLFDDGSVQNFFDSGLSGNYSDNENEEIVICPDLVNGSKITAAFAINVGFTWDVDGSDTLYVFDGPSTASTLLGAHNSVTNPVGFAHTASFANTSGCLTIKFVSDASINGTGWDAGITCGNPPQPYQTHIEALLNGSGSNIMNPLDTGYVDLCFEDSVLLTASGTFPYSLENNGFGYSQNNNNCTYDWEFSDGTTANTQSVYFKPPNRAGYLVTLRMTDPIGYINVIKCKIRVSTIPSFAGTMPLDDTICIGEGTMLIGGVTQTDTVGVDPTQGSFEIGGVFAGLTYLPDGSGQQYTTSIAINGFLPGQTITSGTDIVNMCVTMEHSYLGDLEMRLTCPNGTNGTVFNSFGPGGMIAGGFNGGGTFLGQADDSGNGTPGIGWEYCFEDGATWGNMAQEFAAGNTTPTTTPSPGNAMSAGTYKPETLFNTFIGCPINGNWTLTVQDNLGIDDGFIFEWGIYFNPAINPNTEFYTPTIVSESWLPDPTILTGQSDTAIIINPTTPGDYFYTFQVTDDFGCTYDTTIQVHVLGLPTLPASAETCDLFLPITGVTAPGAVAWTTVSQPAGSNIIFSPSTSALNPTITVDQVGIYSFTIADLECNQSQTIDIYYLDDPIVNITGATLCVEEEVTLDATNINSTYLWTNGVTDSIVTFSSLIPGTYIINVDVTNLCTTVSDTAFFTVDECAVIIPNVFTPNNDGDNEFFYIEGLERHENSILKIFNRWGNIVYENGNYINNWNGDNKNGKPVSDGTYYYVLILENGDDYKGTVTILKERN